jgi:two-component system sensor histidine kinase BaeS
VDDLYHLSLSDVGALQYYFVDVDIVDVLDELLVPFRRRFADAGITLRTALPDHPCWVSGDETRLQQVFSNVLQNALRYVSSGERVEIGVRESQSNIAIDIQDSGDGVPEASLDALFGRFYRVEASRSRATGGAGLGLPICRSIIEAHGGTITAAKAPQGGLWMAISLPRRENEA